MNRAEAVSHVRAAVCQKDSPLAPVEGSIGGTRNELGWTLPSSDEVQQVDVVSEKRDAICTGALRIGEFSKEILEVELVAGRAVLTATL